MRCASHCPFIPDPFPAFDLIAVSIAPGRLDLALVCVAAGVPVIPFVSTRAHVVQTTFATDTFAPLATSEACNVDALRLVNIDPAWPNSRILWKKTIRIDVPYMHHHDPDESESVRDRVQVFTPLLLSTGCTAVIGDQWFLLFDQNGALLYRSNILTEWPLTERYSQWCAASVHRVPIYIIYGPACPGIHCAGRAPKVAVVPDARGNTRH